MDQDEIITVLTPSKRSFSADEELEIMKLAGESLTGKDIKDGIKRLVDKYYWIPFGYDGPMIYNEGHYLKIIEETKSKGHAFVLDKIQQLSSYETQIEEKQKIILEKYEVSLNLQKRIKDAYTLASMTDKKKEYTFQAHEAFSHVLQSLAKKLGIDYLQTKFLTPEEMSSDNRESLVSKAEKRMNGWMVGHFYDGKLSIIDGPEAEEMVKELLPKQDENVSIIQGTTGCKGNGIVQGTVRILSRVNEIVKMKEGEILVSQMTTPEFVPAMRKAIAIITDEGGITCHAAIVAREMKKPAVIGTKIATHILKDGDLVEVDADNLWLGHCVQGVLPTSRNHLIPSVYKYSTFE